MGLEVKVRTTRPLEGNIRLKVTLRFVMRFKQQNKIHEGKKKELNFTEMTDFSAWD